LTVLNYENIRESMILALQNEVGYLWYCDHIMDNSFIRHTLDSTIRYILNKFTPIGFCRKPEYCPEKGVGFLLQDNQTGEDIWVHVPKTTLKRWLREANLPDDLFQDKDENGMYI